MSILRNGLERRNNPIDHIISLHKSHQLLQLEARYATDLWLDVIDVLYHVRKECLEFLCAPQDLGQFLDL